MDAETATAPGSTRAGARWALIGAVAAAGAAGEDSNRALAKLDAGTSAIGERCAHPTPRERLKARP